MKIMGNFTHSKVVELCYCDLNVSTANYITNFSRIKKNKGGNVLILQFLTIFNSLLADKLESIFCNG